MCLAEQNDQTERNRIPGVRREDRCSQGRGTYFPVIDGQRKATPSNSLEREVGSNPLRRGTSPSYIDGHEESNAFFLSERWDDRLLP